MTESWHDSFAERLDDTYAGNDAGPDAALRARLEDWAENALDPQAAASLIREHIARWAAAPDRDPRIFAFGPNSYRDPKLLTETVVTVLDEHEQMAEELEQLRGERTTDTGAVAKALIALHDVKLPLLVGLAVAELEDTFLSRLAQHVAPEAFARFEAKLAKRDDATEAPR